MLGEKIMAKIEAKYYFGSPVTRATVKYKVLRTSHSDTWYPLRPWDWCYGPGYWWFAYDYAWYPGFRNWAGCHRPMPIWWPRFDRTPPEVVAEVEREIGPEGTVEIEFDTAIAKELHGDTDHKYTIQAEVRDQSRRTIVGSGQVLLARKPFKVFTWLDRGYYRTGDVVEANFLAQTLDRKPVQGKGTLKLLKISYDTKQQPTETTVDSWNLDTNAEGLAQQKIQVAAPGQYRLSYTLTDSQQHAIEGGCIFTIVGERFDGADFRFSSVELIPDQAEYQPGDNVKLQLNTNRADSTVLLFLRPTNGVCLEPKVLRLKGKSAIEDIAVVKKDMPNFFVEAVTIAGGRVYSETKEIVVPPEKRVLNVEVLPSQKEYRPGEKGKVKLHLTDAGGADFIGSTVLTMYDKSVEYISGGSNVGDIKEFFWKWRRHHHPQQQDRLQSSYNVALPNKPVMQSIGIFGSGVAYDDDNKAGVAGMLGRGNLGDTTVFAGAPGRSYRRLGAAMMAPASAAAAVKTESAAWMRDPSPNNRGEAEDGPAGEAGAMRPGDAAGCAA